MLSKLEMVGNWYINEPARGWQFDEIKFDEEAKQAFETIDLNIKIYDHSARVDVRSNHSYIPTHYFLYALKLHPLVTLVNKYIEVFDSLRVPLSPQQIRDLIHSSSPSNPLTDSLDTYSKANFFDVFRDKTKRLKGKDIINGTGTNTTLRGSDDFVKSIILKALPVPDVSSDMLGQLIYGFSQSPAAFDMLFNKYFPSIPYLFQDELGDELLFKILSTLGWEGKLDSLFQGASTEETIDWGTISNAFLLKAANVVGNNNYLETPIHYSEALGKYVFVKKGLLDLPQNMEAVSILISGLWPRTKICRENSVFLLRSSIRSDKREATLKVGANKIFYGAPGTGKSHKIHTVEFTGVKKVVTVFHPDTQYNDFIGALKPMMKTDAAGNSTVTYQFRPGPFTNALVKAKKSPSTHVCLVIEEINRAPAAAVFGELFQLLDRNTTGESTYKIDAADPDMLLYINEQLRSSGVTELQQLEIPSNLSILATMNSSDQAVMPLDTAFKRRWGFEYLEIDFSNSAVPQTEIEVATGNGKYAIKWPDLAKAINDVLMETGIAEDRLIGPFFLNPKELSDSSAAKDALNGKLFVYLWDDVLRHIGQHKVFSSSYKTFGGLSAAFNSGLPVFSAAIDRVIEDKGVAAEVPEAAQDADE
ncbi:McrB family protein [Vibrio sp. 10N.261.51.F12]|uniref:McrB family protein n=1 Tax=Vibrio sp. 10N.261.51.F12 TaxID=3229679 RepID=UPI00354DAE5C